MKENKKQLKQNKRRTKKQLEKLTQTFLSKKVGRLIVLKVAKTDKYGRKMLCQCICGNKTEVYLSDLIRKHKLSCGCRKKEVLGENSIKHGKYNSKTYSVWKGMRNRCNNKNSKDYKNYGDRGIKVCKHWDNFENFLKDMGEKPRDLTIERINNSIGYNPKNCKWATMKEQANNKRTNYEN